MKGEIIKLGDVSELLYERGKIIHVRPKFLFYMEEFWEGEGGMYPNQSIYAGYFLQQENCSQLGLAHN